MQSREPRLRTARPDGGRAVVFAAMGNFLKINEAVLRVWHRIMMAVPGSRRAAGYDVSGGSAAYA